MNSMTGFGSATTQTDQFMITADIRSVNYKYLEINIRMPSYMLSFEEKLKSIIKESVNRGRIDVFLRIDKKSEAKSKVIVDEKAALMMYESLNNLRETLEMKEPVKLEHLLIYEEILQYERKEINEEETLNALKQVVKEALSKLLKMKEQEGSSLHDKVDDYLEELEILAGRIEKRRPHMIEETHNKMRERIKELTGMIEIDDYRLEMEMAILVDKTDVEEEIVRLYSHIEQFRMTLQAQGAIGKKMDFITQELNREINTISSKSNDQQLTNLVIEGKSIIERIREQIQNIE